VELCDEAGLIRTVSKVKRRVRPLVPRGSKRFGRLYCCWHGHGGCGLFVWAAIKDGQEDKALQARVGIRRRTRLAR
jgi:hypothetical protein